VFRLNADPRVAAAIP